MEWYDISFARPVADQLYIVFGEGNGLFPFCHSYIYDGEVLILFDPQCGRNRLRKALLELDKSLGDIDFIYNSHFHFDHSGSNHYIQKKSGAKLFIHEMDRIALENFDEYIKRYGIEDEKIEMQWRNLLKSLGYRETSVDSTFNERDILQGNFQVIHTPGHAPGHCCFYKSGVMIAGDIDLTSPWVGNLSSDVADYLKSIEKLLEYDITSILPGHGLPVFKNIPERLDTFRQRLLSKINAIYRLIPEKPTSLDDITKLMFDDFSEKLKKRHQNGQDQFSFHFAAISTLNYLKYLELQGKVQRFLHNSHEVWQKIQ